MCDSIHKNIIIYTTTQLHYLHYLTFPAVSIRNHQMSIPKKVSTESNAIQNSQDLEEMFKHSCSMRTTNHTKYYASKPLMNMSLSKQQRPRDSQPCEAVSSRSRSGGNIYNMSTGEVEDALQQLERERVPSDNRGRNMRQYSGQRQMRRMSNDDNGDNNNIYNNNTFRYDIEPMQSTNILTGPDDVTDETRLYGRLRIATNGPIQLNDASLSTLDEENVNFLADLLNSEDVDIWLGPNLSDPHNKTVWISDSPGLLNLCKKTAGITNSTSRERGSFNVFKTVATNINFKNYYISTRSRNQVVPSKYGVRVSQNYEFLYNIAAELMFTLRMSIEDIGPDIYGFYIERRALHASGAALARSVYLMQAGMNLYSLIEIITHRGSQEVSLSAIHPNLPTSFATMGIFLKAHMQKISNMRYIVSDIKLENMVVMNIDLDTNSYLWPDLRLIDFDPKFAGQVKPEDASTDCIFVLNAFLLLNDVLTNYFATYDDQHKIHNEIIVYLLQNLVEEYEATLPKVKGTFSFDNMCTLFFTAGDKDDVRHYENEVEQNRLYMYNTDKMTQAKALMERTFHYGKHDNELLANGEKSSYYNRRFDQDIILTISNKLLNHFELLKEDILNSP